MTFQFVAIGPIVARVTSAAAAGAAKTTSSGDPTLDLQAPLPLLETVNVLALD